MNSVLDHIRTDERGLVVTCQDCGARNRLAYERLGQSFRCGKCQTDLAPPAEPIDLGSETAFEALIGRSALPVLIDFWAPWCGPCKMVAPEFTKVAAGAGGRYVVAKVNTEELPALAQRFEISGIPTMALFKDGRELARQSGAMPAIAIQQFVERALRVG
jgi:thioredoxin 2